MRIKFLKYGRRKISEDGNSEYFETSVEVLQGEDPAECAQKAKQFVVQQLKGAEVKSLSAKIGEIAAKAPAQNSSAWTSQD